MQGAPCPVALWGQKGTIPPGVTPPPHQGSARTALSLRRLVSVGALRSVRLALCLYESFLSSQYITWSWRTRTASPAPLCSPSQSLSCHTAPGEPSKKAEDRNWPILDQNSPRLRESCRESWDSPSSVIQNRKWQRRQQHCDSDMGQLPSLHW